MKLAALIVALDAVDITGRPADVRPSCVDCGGPVSQHRDGRPTLCAPCTYTELGVSAYDLALMTEFRLSRTAYYARLEKFGWPNFSPKAWITSKSRLF